MYPVASVVLCIVVAVGYILFQIYSGTGMVSLDFGRSSDTSDVPVRKDSVVFITDGAKGVTREAAVTLATYGYHVLIGVKSEAEKKSFLYENGKGIESIVFDIADPATLPAVVYRIREIHRDFERPLSGVVINSFG